MAKEIMAIYDSDMAYLERLQNYLMEKERMPFDIQIFSREEPLKELLERNAPGVLLVAEGVYEEWLTETGAGECIMLMEKGSTDTSMKTVDKYQSADELWSDVLRICSGNENIKFGNVKYKSASPVIAFFSPLSRVLQTRTALALGAAMSNENVLYISFEIFSGLEQIFLSPAGQDLMDLVYFYGCDRQRMMLKLESMTFKIKNLHILQPACDPEEMLKVEGEVWKGLIDEIAASGMFKYIILDLKPGINGMWEILEGSDCIVRLMRQQEYGDVVDGIKARAYQKYVHWEKNSALSEKEICVEIPPMGGLGVGIREPEPAELKAFIREMLLEQIQIRFYPEKDE